MSKEAMKLALKALGLLVEERSSEAMDDGYKAIKALEEALKQEQGEPVAWMFEFPDKRVAPKFDSAPHGGDWKPLYTTPQQRKPLRDEMLNQMRESCESNNMEMRGAFIDGWTSAEAAHGIKE
jgi:hypothetical protein